MSGPRTLKFVSRGRMLLRPRWLLLHVITLTMAVAMIMLGRWQLTVSEHKGFSLQNFGYALQWWLFTAFALGMWVRVVRDATRTSDGAFQAAESSVKAPTEVPYRRYVMPQSGSDPVLDPAQAAYNDYLARLAESDAEQAAEKGTSR
jgi:DNA-binding transcriptional regulator of glucitol operon